MTVVNVRKDYYTVYIGRGSIYGNPFLMKVDGNREEVIAKYEKYVRTLLMPYKIKGSFSPLINAIYNLSENAILGCYCKPKACHGDVIVKIWKELHNEIS